MTSLCFLVILANCFCFQFIVFAKNEKPVLQKGNKSANLSPQYNSYLEQLRNKILQFWLLPDGNNHVIISVSLSQDGSVSDLSISSSPSNNLAEQAASDAFNQAQPFPALPSNSQAVRLSVTFDSKADPHGDSTSKLYAKIDPIKPTTDSTQTGP
jgi:TonB family protein